MIAAIYARKSTEQHGDAEMKSVVRQTDNARAFAQTKGWRVAELHVYSDDAVSGAETRKLVQKERLLETIAAGAAPFQVLIMRDTSRFSRRDGDEAFGELKRIAQAGIQIWFYLDGTRFTYGTFGDNVVGFVRAEMNAEYRRAISLATKESHVRKFQAGHAVGGACFGYTNVRINGHTERRIDPAQADVVRRIFTASAAGAGYTRICKDLNADGVLTPSGRPWSPSTLLAVLKRPLYRGEVVWNMTRRRAPDGTATFARRPETEWLRVDCPDLRIIDDSTWHAVRTRIERVRARLQTAAPRKRGPQQGARRDRESPYLLAGFTRCAECGGSVGVLDRRQYGCIAYHKRGPSACRNALKLPIAALEDAVRETLGTDVLRPAVVKATLAGVLAALAPDTINRDLARNQQQLAKLDREVARLTDAIAQGGHLPPLLEALTTRQDQRAFLSATVAAQTAVNVRRLNRAAVNQKVDERTTGWHAALAGSLEDQRQLLREILVGPIMLTPDADVRAYEFAGEAQVGTLLAGTIGLPMSFLSDW
jgi:DNA invertase Pin-like site-specific DNA recombinase